MGTCLAFVLGGGGARGAMQLGALRAMFEAGYKPDLLVGTSIGAANAAGLAYWGANLEGVAAMEEIYRNVAHAHLMDPRLGQLTLRILAGRPNHHASKRVHDFFISSGLAPDFRFNQIQNLRLGLVGADLNSGQPVIFGQDTEQFVLDGVMASIALPPWFAPVEQDGHLVVDGGALSNLPIEPALSMGATEIIAFDLDDPRMIPGNEKMNRYLGKLIYAISRRYVDLESKLAEAKGVPVRFLELQSKDPTPIWDFARYKELIQWGYEIASATIADWKRTSWIDLTSPPMFSIN